MVSTRSMRINVDRTQYRDSAVNESPIIRATTFRSKSYLPEEFSTLRCSASAVFSKVADDQPSAREVKTEWLLAVTKSLQRLRTC